VTNPCVISDEPCCYDSPCVSSCAPACSSCTSSAPTVVTPTPIPAR
jgi:hypothetical protein